MCLRSRVGSVLESLLFPAPGFGGNFRHTCVDEVLARCEVCRAFEKWPHVPVAGTSTVATFNEKLQADFAFLGDVIALHVVDVCSR